MSRLNSFINRLSNSSTESNGSPAAQHSEEHAGSSLAQDLKRNLVLELRNPPRPLSIQKTDQNVEEDLLNALQCPVCFEYMTPPITLCENGHSICQDCKPNFNSCPTCRKPLLSIRNVVLEGLARSLLYPCKYADDGCTEKYNVENINKHLEICPYRIYECLLQKKVCPWRGKITDFKAHMIASHSKRVSIFEDASATCVIWEISYAGCFRDYTHIIFAFGEVFIYKKKFNVEEKKLYFTVQHKGWRETAGKFRYKYKMFKNNDQQKISISNVVHSEKDDISAVMMSGQCVFVDFITLVAFSKGRRVFCIMKSKD